jgi:uncharacterized membrane protein
MDGAFVLLLALLLASTLGEWCASRTVELLDIGQADTVWRGPVPLVLGILGNVVYALPVVCLIALLPEAVVGRGPGKLVLRLHILHDHSDAVVAQGSRGASLPLRFLLKMLPCVIWVLALAFPDSGLAVSFVVTEGLVLVGCLPVFWGGVALHDRLASTRVLPETNSDL